MREFYKINPKNPPAQISSASRRSLWRILGRTRSGYPTSPTSPSLVRQLMSGTDHVPSSSSPSRLILAARVFQQKGRHVPVFRRIFIRKTNKILIGIFVQKKKKCQADSCRRSEETEHVEAARCKSKKREALIRNNKRAETLFCGCWN